MKSSEFQRVLRATNYILQFAVNPLGAYGVFLRASLVSACPVADMS